MRLLADRDAIERLVTAQRLPRYRLKRAVGGFVTAIVATFVIPLMASGGWRGIAAYVRAKPWSAIGVPLGLAVIFTIVSVASTYGAAASDVPRIARRIERDWVQLNQGKWIARVVVGGVVMALVIGIPIGTLIAFNARLSELPQLGGRAGIVGAFLLMTLLWTVPMGFVIRFLTLRSYRRYFAPNLRTMTKGNSRPEPNVRSWLRRSFWSIAGLTGFTVLNATRVHAQPIVRRDSAGIRVIEVAANGLDALPTWRLEGPTTRIEPSMGGVEYEFTRAGTPWRLADGRIVLANNQVELRFFDAKGRYLTTVARRGRGPGEYEQLLRVFRVAGDTLLAWDVPTSRVDVRDPNGKLVRAFLIPRTLRFAGLGGRGAVFVEYQRPDLQKLGVRQDTVTLRQLYKDGTAGEVVGRLPGSWTEVLPARGGGAWRGVELSGSDMLAGGLHGAVYVQGDEFTAYWFGDPAKLSVITRVRLPRARVTATDRRDQERLRSELIARNPQVRVDPGQAPAVYAAYLPQVTRLIVDAEGRAWLRRWTRYGARTAEWIVLEGSGAPIARITMPAALQPNDIGRDYVLGILPDEDGVQSVHEYRIVR